MANYYILVDCLQRLDLVQKFSYIIFHIQLNQGCIKYVSTDLSTDVTIVFPLNSISIFFIKNSMSIRFFTPILGDADINSSALGVIGFAGV